MRLSPRYLLIVFSLLAAAVLAAGGSSTWSAFSATTSNGPSSMSSAADWTGPTVSASVIAHSSKGPGVKASGTYAIYANASDSGNPASGVSTVAANVNSITSGQTAVALPTCSTSCTVNGVTYAYKSAQLTAGSTLAAGSVSYTVTGKDAANNTGTANGFSVTVDNTVPTAGAAAAAHAFAGALIKQNGSYWVYANATDTGSGIDTVSASVTNITTGQSAVALTSCSSSCTVGGVTYGYKSAQLTSNTTLAAGSKTFTITATDVAGNVISPATSFSTTVDNTGPSGSDVQTKNNGVTAGKAELGDSITLTRSEQIDPNSILAGWTGATQNVVVRITNSGANDIVTFWNAANTTQLPLGSIDLGGAGYITTSTTVTFGATGTASTMVQSGANVTITLGTPSGTTKTVAAKTGMIWTPSTTPTDLAGNAGSGTTVSETGLSDVEF
jgi:hypothetical protein